MFIFLFCSSMIFVHWSFSEYEPKNIDSLNRTTVHLCYVLLWTMVHMRAVVEMRSYLELTDSILMAFVTF
jgi:hypothetical protein